MTVIRSRGGKILLHPSGEAVATALDADPCCCVCVVTSACAATSVPVAAVYLLDAGSVGGGAGTCCGGLGGEHLLVTAPKVDMLRLEATGTPGVFDEFWTGVALALAACEDNPQNEPETPDVYLEGCLWASTRTVRPLDSAGDPPTVWPVSQARVGDPCEDDDSYSRLDIGGPFSGAHPHWWAGIQRRTSGGIQYRVIAVGSIWNYFTQNLFPYWTPTAYGLYAAPWSSSPDYSTGTTTLSLITRTNASYDPLTPGPFPIPSPYVCTFPSTVTLTRPPTGVERVFAGCDKVCDPEINTDPYGIVVVSGMLGGAAFSVCLAPDTDTDTGLLDYVGVLLSHSACPGDTLTFTLLCVPGTGGAAGQWTLRVSDGSTTIDLPVTVASGDPLSGTVSGTLTGICGGAALVADVSACSDAGRPWLACLDSLFPDLSAARRCCFGGCLTAAGTAVPSDPQQETNPCEGNTNTCSATITELCHSTDPFLTENGIDAASGYFAGSAPLGWDVVGEGERIADRRIVVTCAGAVYVLKSDDSIDPDWTVYSVSSDGESFIVRLEWNGTMCCGGLEFQFFIEVRV